MELHVLKAVLTEIDEGTEGAGFALNIRTRSGNAWRDYTVFHMPAIGEGYYAETGLLRLDRDGYPPVYLHCGDIESVELSAD